LSTQHEDVVMKSIMELFKGDAVKFFGIDKRVISAAPTELSHIPVQKNINDWVLYADDDSYIHFEFQSDYSKKDLARFMVSDAMLYYNEGKPIKTIVVYSSDIKETITAIIFASILCVFLLLYGLVMVVISDININIGIGFVKYIFAGIAYYIFTVILLNLLLVIKRMSKIIELSYNTVEEDKKE